MSATPEDPAHPPAAPGPSDSPGNGLCGRLIDMSGDGASRGAAHGEELRDLIADSLDRWRADIGRRTGDGPRAYVRAFLASTGFVKTIASASPDLYQEVLAIAAASNQPADDMLVYNMMDEQWRFDRKSNTGCSVIGTAVRNGPDFVLGQNMDLPLSMDGSQAVLRIAGDGRRPDQLVLTAAGLIGLLGVNAAGLACCVNTLGILPAAATGMPVAFIVREVLGHRDAVTAAGYLTSVPHASGQHYAIADRHGLHSYECSARGWAAGPRRDELVHTNHPLWWPDESIAGDVAAVRQISPTTYQRLQALRAGLDRVRASGDLETLLSSSSDGVCVLPTPERASATFCSAEFTLTSPPAVRVALGRPDRTVWTNLGWTNSGPAGAAPPPP
ncbi:C45 family autoproteolytic acyltransferase/hydolase [Acrocarpospora macrocephala]|nr:C45 family peptidase [Acrocarpospora macrocephala]